MSTIVERINIYAKHKKTTKAAIERESGLPNATFKPTTQSLRIDAQSKIAKSFPDLNIGWLLTGEGSMLKDNTGATQTDNTIINPTNTQATMDPLTMDYINTLKEQLATMKEQLKEKDALIRKLTQQGDDEVLSRRLGAVKEKQDELTNKP
jgi:hypothetical protein